MIHQLHRRGSRKRVGLYFSRWFQDDDKPSCLGWRTVMRLLSLPRCFQDLFCLTGSRMKMRLSPLSLVPGPVLLKSSRMETFFFVSGYRSCFTQKFQDGDFLHCLLFQDLFCSTVPGENEAVFSVVLKPTLTKSSRRRMKLSHLWFQDLFYLLVPGGRPDFSAWLSGSSSYFIHLDLG